MRLAAFFAFDSLGDSDMTPRHLGCLFRAVCSMIQPKFLGIRSASADALHLLRDYTSGDTCRARFWEVASHAGWRCIASRLKPLSSRWKGRPCSPRDFSTWLYGPAAAQGVYALRRWRTATILEPASTHPEPACRHDRLSSVVLTQGLLPRILGAAHFGRLDCGAIGDVQWLTNG